MTISKFLNKEYSHAGIIVDNNLVYHATAEGFHISPLAEFLKNHYLVKEYDVTKYVTQLSYALGWLDGNLGKDYPETDLFAAVVRRMTGHENSFGDGASEMYCSEACARFLEKCTSLDIFDHIDCDFVFPDTLEEYLDRVFMTAPKETTTTKET